MRAEVRKYNQKVAPQLRAVSTVHNIKWCQAPSPNPRPLTQKTTRIYTIVDETGLLPPPLPSREYLLDKDFTQELATLEHGGLDSTDTQDRNKQAGEHRWF